MVDNLRDGAQIDFVDRIEKHATVFRFFGSWEYSQRAIDLFEKEFNSSSLIYICCSGGPDSMFLTYLLVRYRHVVKGLPMSITKILHVNHKTSLCDERLMEIVFTNFGGIFDICTSIFSSGVYTETVLRKKRWEFYLASLHHEIGGGIPYLCLGHNLDDRIENSLLHFDRGTHIQGVVNMQMKTTRYLFNCSEMTSYICFRPLLRFQKKQISEWCDQFGIPYYNDSHNSDLDQKRIQYRNAIRTLPKNEQIQFYRERQYVYRSLEKNLTSDVFLKKIPHPLFRDVLAVYKTICPKTKQHLVALLSLLGIFVNMSTKRLDELMKWCEKGSGSLYMGGWRFLSTCGMFFVVQQPKKRVFWEERYPYTYDMLTKDMLSLDSGYERNGGVYMDNDAILCFPQVGDYIGSVKYMHRAAKQHIPFFRRRSLPIVKKNTTIYTVLPKDYWPWNM